MVIRGSEIVETEYRTDTPSGIATGHAFVCGILGDVGGGGGETGDGDGDSERVSGMWRALFSSNS